ncbi:MAG: serine/threonine-protein kinase [Gemmatimonadaceae bacterium]
MTLLSLSIDPDPLFVAFQSAIAGRYSIDRELGRGGMGVVYLAREVRLDRLVAIKLLPPVLSAQSSLREGFLREAQLAAKLSHPNIIPIHSVEQIDAFVFYVMAFVEGETLAQRVQSRGPLSASDAIRVLREVSWALSYAHDQGLVHRDVKPDNILLESSTGRALVADFGIAAATGDVHGEGIRGTPEFMSPEQALGGTIDARSDLYSLGATAFYALSARLPFEGKTPTEVLARQVTEAAPSLTTVGTHVPRKLAQLVDRCLSKDPASRPSSAQALADELGIAIEKRRELPAALRAFVKRTGRMDGGGTVLGLLGVLGTTIAAAAVGGPTVGVTTFAVSMLSLPVLFSIIAARQLTNFGFTQADLRPAFQSELESAREERSVQKPSRFSLRRIAERLMSKVARVSGAAGAVLIPFAIAELNTPSQGRFGGVITFLFAIAALSTFGFLVLMQTRRDVDVEFWNSFWSGRVGTFAFSIARKLRGAKPMAPAMTHRATELSLGMAAEQLFESLPKSSRETLGDLPTLLQRLQRDAHMLRTRHDTLQDTLAQAGASSASEHYAAVREERDAMQEKMRETVGAMEAIRLGLLRLHAGSLTLEGMTTHVGLAADMSTHLERMLSAQTEVDELLRQSSQLTSGEQRAA